MHLEPRNATRSRRWWLIGALSCAAALLAGRPLLATDCETSTAALVLVGVVEEGVPATDLAAYREAKVVLYARGRGEVEVVAKAREFANPFWRETYRASMAPGR